MHMRVCLWDLHRKPFILFELCTYIHFTRKVWVKVLFTFEGFAVVSFFVSCMIIDLRIFESYQSLLHILFPLIL